MFLPREILRFDSSVGVPQMPQGTENQMGCLPLCRK